jgi:predicted RNase H-like nuclease
MDEYDGAGRSDGGLPAPQRWWNLPAPQGVAAALPSLEINASGTEVKAYEDALDAIICARVAICAVEGRAKPFGDENSAIWIPTLLASTTLK